MMPLTHARAAALLLCSHGLAMMAMTVAHNLLMPTMHVGPCGTTCWLRGHVRGVQSIRQMREEMAAVQANMLRDYQAQMMAAAAGGRPGAGSSAGGGMDPNAGMMGMTPDAMLDMLPGGYSRLGS